MEHPFRTFRQANTFLVASCIGTDSAVSAATVDETDRAIPLQAAYCAAKHAVQGFTESLRCELLHEKSRVRVTIVHLPAMNTPHFSWVKSRLPRKPQPVPPIYQPEIAADAIVWAASHNRRELQVGMPTVVAVDGNKVLAGFMDRYLARTGYERTADR